MEEIIIDIITNQDYKAFSTEQIKFKNDTVYMVVY